jgi:transcriptional regulator with XRE-family HTH domain
MNDIERLLDELRISPAALARRLGVSEATVSRWRSGQHSPSGLYAVKVADLLAAIDRRKGGSANAGEVIAMVTALLDHTSDSAPAPASDDDNDYRRGYRQGYRDAVASMLTAVVNPPGEFPPTEATEPSNDRNPERPERLRVPAG